MRIYTRVTQLSSYAPYTKRHAESLIQNVRSFRIEGAMSIHGYRIINYPNLELDKFARVLVSYKPCQEAISLIRSDVEK